MSYDFLKGGEIKPDGNPLFPAAGKNGYSQAQVEKLNQDRIKAVQGTFDVSGSKKGDRVQQGYQDHMDAINAVNAKRSDPSLHAPKQVLGNNVLQWDDFKDGRGYGSRGGVSTPIFQPFPGYSLNPDRRANPGFSVPATGLFGLRY